MSENFNQQQHIREREKKGFQWKFIECHQVLSTTRFITVVEDSRKARSSVNKVIWVNRWNQWYVKTRKPENDNDAEWQSIFFEGLSRRVKFGIDNS